MKRFCEIAMPVCLNLRRNTTPEPAFFRMKSPSVLSSLYCPRLIVTSIVRLIATLVGQIVFLR